MAGSTAEYIGELVFKLLGMNAGRKREVADYMAGIADTLGKFGPKLREGAKDELWGLASETQSLAERFAKATADVLPEKDRRAHTDRLLDAFNAKSLLAAGGGGDAQEKLLRTIAENAGAFRAAAASLRGSAGKLG